MVVPTIFRTHRPVELGMIAQPRGRFSTLRNAPVVSPATTCSLITPAGRLAGNTRSMFEMSSVPSATIWSHAPVASTSMESAPSNAAPHVNEPTAPAPPG